MTLHAREFVFFVLLSLASIIDSLKCPQILDVATKTPSPLEGRFWITVTILNQSDSVDDYLLNTKYNVTIEGRSAEPEGSEQFTRFLLTVENRNETHPAGHFDIADEFLTQFSDKCPSAVVESNQIPKTQVSVIWTSPSESVDCVIIRAIVVENAESWFMSEGGLERILCQNEDSINDDPGPVNEKCCACDEAKYEVTFEGLWSRNTHPKDFPSKGWLIRFSDIIGASHTTNYTLWEHGEIVSAGLQQVAENGMTRTLESELKSQSDKIRTIIKARGITFPNVTGRTFAVFRVDNLHHLMSLVSKIVPSPDWIVGISGLELCLSNCSWVEHKELNLYPFDAGIDSGITYTSSDPTPDQPEPIRRITSTYPNDTRSPFYDPTGLKMKPLAKLHLNRQRLYEKACENTNQDSDTDSGEKSTKHPRNKACKTTPWGPWGPCPQNCGGKQLRQRNYRDPVAAVANNCTVTLTDRRSCQRNDPHCVDDPTVLNQQECELTEWNNWSDCTSTCGEGYQTRSRNFKNKKHRKYCRTVIQRTELQQTIPCLNDPCSDPDFEAKCPAEQYHNWSNWAPCTTSCGEGVTSRTRQPIDESAEAPEECKTQMTNCTASIISCEITPQDATEICNEPVLSGDCNGRYKRTYYDPQSGQCHFFDYTGCNGNRNNFHTLEECIKVCINYEEGRATKENYRISISSVLSYHIPGQEQRSPKAKRDEFRDMCHKATRSLESKEEILAVSRNEEDASFNGIESDNQISSTDSIYNNTERVDCRYTDWSPWSRCHDCRGFTYKRREILVKPRNGGARCPTKLERKMRCRKTEACRNKKRKEHPRSIFRDRNEYYRYGKNLLRYYNDHNDTMYYDNEEIIPRLYKRKMRSLSIYS